MILGSSDSIPRASDAAARAPGHATVARRAAGHLNFVIFAPYRWDQATRATREAFGMASP